MKISIFVYGTRGDVQPMLAIATALKEKGHDILFIANPENEAFVKSYNLKFIPFGPNVKEGIAENAAKKKSPVRFSLATFGDFKKITENQVTQLPEIIKGSDLVLNAGLGLGVPTAADMMGIPYRFVVFYPMLLGSGNKATVLTRMKARLMNLMNDAYLKGMINKRRKEAGISPVKVVSLSWIGPHIIVAADAVLNKVNDGVTAKYTQTGYPYLKSHIPLSRELEQFISAGKPPVFIGFGSNPIYYPQELTKMFEGIADSTKERLIVSKGWANLEKDGISNDVFYVDDVAYEDLFPRMAAVIHHGGTGTMSYAARAGIPQAAFPFMTDQFVNRNRIAALGIGPETCNFTKMNAQSIEKAIMDIRANVEFKHNALRISDEINRNDGLELTVGLIEKEMLTLNH